MEYYLNENFGFVKQKKSEEVVREMEDTLWICEKSITEVSFHC